MSTSNDNQRPLVDLSQIEHPLMRMVMRVAGPVLRRLLKIDEVNQLESDVAGLESPESFFRTTLELLGCQYEASEEDLGRIPETGPVVVVSNHPLGGLDGIILGDMLRRRRGDVKLMANYLLKRVRHAGQHMIFVDPFDKELPAARNISPLRECLRHLKQGGLLGVFPGNKVSHYRRETGEVSDPDWVPHIAALIRRSGATVVPVYIEARNSWLFERIGLVHPLLRTLMLTREFIKRARSGVPVRVSVGTAIAGARLKKFESNDEMIQYLRMCAYMLKNRSGSESRVVIEGASSMAPASPKPLAERLPAEVLELDIAALPAAGRLLSQGDFEVFIGRYDELPNVMLEIGRGREESFRHAGGGTGEALDLAEADRHYLHLFVWSRRDRAVVGAYRLGLADEILRKLGPEGLVSSGLFEFTPAFLEFVNSGLELGRSYVLPEFQRSYSSLLLLWGGILAFIARNPRYRMTFGSVGVSQGGEYCAASRALIVEFLLRKHGQLELANELRSRSPFVGMTFGRQESEAIRRFVNEVEDVSTLVSGLERDGKGVPILIKHYLKMNASLIDFGVWRTHSHALVGFLLVDLVKSDPKFLRRYMGVEGYQGFMRHHGLGGREVEPKGELVNSIA